MAKEKLKADRAEGGKRVKADKKKPRAEKGERSETEKAKKDAATEKPEKKPVRKKHKKSREIRKIQAKIKKKHLPKFRGRFGKRSVRRKSKKKWQRWRKPRGIDILFMREDGRVPKTGYRTSKDIRFRHPSGYFERLVRNIAELGSAAENKDTAVKIASGVGAKKRKELLKKADELGVLVLNRREGVN